MLLAVAVFVVIVTVPTAAALLGAPSLQKLSTDPAAMTNLVSLGAGRLGTFITLAIVVAIFNALVANIMGFGRVLWSRGSRPGPAAARERLARGGAPAVLHALGGVHRDGPPPAPFRCSRRRSPASSR